MIFGRETFIVRVAEDAMAPRVRAGDYVWVEQILNLYFVHESVCRRDLSLDRTPAMAAGLAGVQHSIEWIAGLIDERTPPPSRPAVYRK